MKKDDRLNGNENQMLQETGGSQPVQNNKKRQNNVGLKVAVTMLAVALIALGAGFWWYASTMKPQTQTSSNAEALVSANYQRSYFDLIAETNDLAVKMSKLDASNSAEQQQSMLYEIWKNAELASLSLSSMSSQDVAVDKLMKFMNQLGDYSHYLAEELQNGEKLTSEQEKTLKSMRDILRNVNEELRNTQNDIENGALSLSTASALNDAMNKTFEKFNDASVEYPQLIYDGPFSDSLENKTARALSGEDIDQATGEKLAREHVENMLVAADIANAENANAENANAKNANAENANAENANAKNANAENANAENANGASAKTTIQNVTFNGEWDTDVKTLNYTLTLSDGEAVDVQLSKQGGKLISMDCARTLAAPTVGGEKCALLAIEFMKEAGYGDLTAVWTSNVGGVYYVNLAPTSDGIILYPDLVKVKVASDNGEILGVDAKNYVFNHTERKLPKAVLNVSEAKGKLKTTFTSNEGRLCVIPYRAESEKLCYEFACENDGMFFVYIDALTGKEVNILFVIDSENGTLLM